IMPISLSLQAQYFGRNKPSYKLFDYKVYTTPHFEIYYYLKNDSMLKRIGIMSEEWYKIHQVLFRDTFKDFNPIILYNNHTDFQQTNAIAGLIDMGTNGATE